MLRPSKPRRGRKPRTERIAAAARSRKPARKNPNRRANGSAPKTGSIWARRQQRPPLSPAERKARNRTVLLMSVLALVNAYVFLWRGEGALASFLGGAPSAVIGGHEGGPLPPVGDPPERACTGDPVRIFEGLDDLVQLEAQLSRGLTLRLALLQLGIEGTEIDGIEAGVRSHVDLGLLGGSGAPLRVAMDRLGGVRALEIELAEGHVLQACRDGEAADG